MRRSPPLHPRIQASHLMSSSPQRSHPLQRVCTKLIGHALLGAVAFNDVAGLHVIGQDNDLVAHGAARGLKRYRCPAALLLAHPEREARSVGTGKDIP